MYFKVDLSHCTRATTMGLGLEGIDLLKWGLVHIEPLAKPLGHFNAQGNNLWYELVENQSF